MGGKEKYYYNETGFSFISNSGGHLEKTPTELKRLVFEAIQAKHYVLDWEEINSNYHGYLGLHKSIDREEFAFNYVLAKSLLNEFGQDKIKKEAMYLDIINEIDLKINY